jgi:hypothetical protein
MAAPVLLQTVTQEKNTDCNEEKGQHLTGGNITTQLSHHRQWGDGQTDKLQETANAMHIRNRGYRTEG